MIKAKYGIIDDCINTEKFGSGGSASIMFSGPYQLETTVGKLIPQYQVEDYGRQLHRPVTFFPNGNVKRIPLQEQTDIKTCYGIFPAELLLFYDDGSLKKLFPLNGKLSGYWNEKNEYALAENINIDLPSGKINAKIINMGFYPSGTIRSITFWPGETIQAECSLGTIKTRKGIAFYEDGGIRSLEPAEPTAVETPIGTLTAFDNDPEGICGDINSLQFDRSGRLSSLLTIADKIIVTTDSGLKKSYEPSSKTSMCSDLVKIAMPMLVEFIGDIIRFNNSKNDEYEVKKCSFTIDKFNTKTAIPSYDCE